MSAFPAAWGGAPGGITFGLKLVYGDSAHVFYAEPVQACCMLLGIATGLHDGICVQDIGLTGLTEADGLAVGRPSKFVGKTVEHLLSGEFTVEDDAVVYLYERAAGHGGLFYRAQLLRGFCGAGAHRAGGGVPRVHGGARPC